MFLKLLCTLCTLVSSSALDHHIPPQPINHNPVQISADIGTDVVYALCPYFVPNITNATCDRALFQASEKVHFMTITNQTMLLAPTAQDGACYVKNNFLCFSKTYQLIISALNASDHRPMIEKEFVITIKGTNKYQIETVMIICVLIGSSITYGVSRCTQNTLQDLHQFRRRMGL